MSDSSTTESPPDGRVARRERNQAAVLDVVLEMFAEDQLFPTIEQASARSGLSPRSVYRYFADPGELLEAAIERSNERGTGVAHISDIGKGTLDERLDTFCESRMSVHDTAGAVWRATVFNAARLGRVKDELALNRERLRVQVERQFAPELDAMSREQRTQRLEAADLISQLDSIEFLRRHRELDRETAIVVVREGLRALLS